MKHICITGGAGFIGCNAALYFARQGYHVTIFDNLSRSGGHKNMAWLEREHSGIRLVQGDVRDQAAVDTLFAADAFDRVLHCAAQVAVTTSVTDPVSDFAINAQGTFNVLEAVRCGKNPKAPFIYTSTNKVYGGLEDVVVREEGTRYAFDDLKEGVSEARCLDFHSPYGCSKGAADQYVRDYARMYGLRTVVFRQSCIYGPRQMGMEDQGWVAWFALRALFGKPVHVYGDGKQVRDILYIDDLVQAYDQAYQKIDTTSGQIYNIGGGKEYAMSVVELLTLLQKRFPDFRWDYNDWRPGDQKIYISNCEKARREFSWTPKISPEEGVDRLIAWIEKNKELFTDVVQ